jgi:hypothetical protein
MAVGGCLLVAAGTLRADDSKVTDVKPSKQYMGSVDDEALLKLAPENGFIGDAKTFAKLWKAWKVGPKIPDVGFKKELVVLATTSGSRINLMVRLTEEGDLKVIGLATADFGPGFRYQIFVVPRAGVKTVNGKELPAGE